MEKASSTRVPECINNLAPNGGEMFAPDTSGRKTGVEGFVLVEDTNNGAVEVTTTATEAVLVAEESEEESSEEESLSSEDSDWESDDEEEEEDDEEDEDWNERLRVLEDARNLKKMAGFFLHPEAPVESSASIAVRCYFHRASAPQVVTLEEAEERATIMRELSLLKQQATNFYHPEKPVVNNGTACGRNFYSRPSAEQYEDEDEMEEREIILEDMRKLKQVAVDYLHPEKPVDMGASINTARSFFDRASAPQRETFGAAEERARILEEAKLCKAQAMQFAHPELPLDVDAAATTRCFFARPAAPEYDAAEDAFERALVVAEAKALKAQATMYAHPETPLHVDATAFARNFFMRPSAPEQDTFGTAEERVRILAETKVFKKQADLYAHPERPVKTTDLIATTRCYFDRASAVVQGSAEEAEERAQVLADAAALKKLAADYLHPEKPLVTSEGTVTGRNYFSRASAPEQEAFGLPEERARVLAEAQAFKKLAVDYLHPEKPVVTSDATSTGRNYFDRASARIHDQMVHTFPVHEDDLHHMDEHHDSVHDHEWDHFGMDEDMDHMFDDMRHDLSLPHDDGKATAAMASSSNVVNKPADGSDEEGKLSRSPSSVMLFAGEQPAN